MQIKEGFIYKIRNFPHLCPLAKSVLANDKSNKETKNAEERGRGRSEVQERERELGDEEMKNGSWFRASRSGIRSKEKDLSSYYHLQFKLFERSNRDEQEPVTVRNEAGG